MTLEQWLKFQTADQKVPKGNGLNATRSSQMKLETWPAKGRLRQQGALTSPRPAVRDALQ